MVAIRWRILVGIGAAICLIACSKVVTPELPQAPFRPAATLDLLRRVELGDAALDTLRKRGFEQSKNCLVYQDAEIVNYSQPCPDSGVPDLASKVLSLKYGTLSNQQSYLIWGPHLVGSFSIYSGSWGSNPTYHAASICSEDLHCNPVIQDGVLVGFDFL